MNSIRSNLPAETDILIIGAGAAGLMAAIAASGAGQGARVVVVNNVPRIGLKILISGGGRCNVTNEQLDERDYTTDAPHLLRGLLRSFSVAQAREFFTARYCPLYAEPLGKLFPKSDKARQVLDVLLAEVENAGASLIAPAEVETLEPAEASSGMWKVSFADGRTCEARRVILATGGKSVPKTGSKGLGFELLAKFGHTIAPPLPALTPVLLKETGPLHGLAGLTVPCVLSLVPEGTPPEQAAGGKFKPLARSGGSMLVTHQGVSGPAALDVSGAVALALHQLRPVKLAADFWSLAQPGSVWARYLSLPKPPGASLAAADCPRPPHWELFQEQGAELFAQRDMSIGRALANRLPRSLVEALLAAAGIDPARLIRQLDPPSWKRVHLAVTQADLQVSGVAGFEKAEVTTGGVLLGELERGTLESKHCPGLYVCGEVVNVTGRLGGFNFQWAWASGFAAGRAAAASLAAS